MKKRVIIALYIIAYIAVVASWVFCHSRNIPIQHYIDLDAMVVCMPLFGCMCSHLLDRIV